ILSCGIFSITKNIYLSSFAYPFPNTHRPTGTSLKGGIAPCNVSTHFSHALPEHKAYQSRWDGMIIEKNGG
ncbi:MAG: hypothetical protein R6U95_07540, partial [Bacteroidales bacterium]